MNTNDFPELQQLLGGYFHQDWTAEFASAPDALLHIVEVERPERLAKACKEIESILKLNLSEESLGKLLNDEIGCSLYTGSMGFSNADWLHYVKEKFQALP